MANKRLAIVTGGARGIGRAIVLELARRLDSRLHSRPSFGEFMAVLEQAVRAKPYRSGGRK